MRPTLPLIALALVTMALPSAFALSATTVQVPDVTVLVKGQTVAVDSSQYASNAPTAKGEVSTGDVDLHLKGPGCTVDPSQKVRKLTTCDTGRVDGPSADPASLVKAQVGLTLAPSAAPAPDAPARATPATEAFVPVTPRAVTLFAAAAAGVSLLGIYAAWRALKWTGLAALLPLYSHISDDEILDDANRAGIYRLIQEQPGISTKDIAVRLGLAWGTVTHHLGKLEKRRFVVSKKYGKYRRYFANGQGGTDQKDQVAVLRLDRTGDVAALIRQQPGVTQKAVSHALGVSSSTILWHVKRLEGANLITKVREGKLVRYYPASEMDVPGFTMPTVHAA